MSIPPGSLFTTDNDRGSTDVSVVLVTGVGGNVGQGVLRNIRSLEPNIRLVGTNVRAFSGGNHLCDSFHHVPYADEPEYLAEIRRIVELERVDVILPTTDLEGYHLAVGRSGLGCRLVVSDDRTMEIYLDKYLSFVHHREHDIPFADSWLPSEFDGGVDEIIVKPRAGRGSRDLHINPTDLSTFSDDHYLVQRLYTGIEVTTAFYVTKTGRLHGTLTMERELVDGTTHQCRVAPIHDDIVNPVVERIVRSAGVRGSANLQSIITDDGRLWPFEVNCRISGTNSIRSQFGFCDVHYALQEYLFHVEPDEPKVINGVATRILLDVIYQHQSDYHAVESGRVDHYIY